MKSLRLILALGFVSTLFAGFARAADEKDASCAESSCCKSAKKEEKKPEQKKP